MFVSFPLLGRVWCAVCPFMIYGELVQKWRTSGGAELLKWPKEQGEPSVRCCMTWICHFVTGRLCVVAEPGQTWTGCDSGRMRNRERTSCMQGPWVTVGNTVRLRRRQSSLALKHLRCIHYRPPPHTHTAEAYGPPFLFSLFAAILMWEEVWDLPNNAYLSGWLLIIITAGAVICSSIFERRLWCRYLCPIGGMNGMFAKLSMTEVRARHGVCASEFCRARSHPVPPCEIETNAAVWPLSLSRRTFHEPQQPPDLCVSNAPQASAALTTATRAAARSRLWGWRVPAARCTATLPS